MCNLVGNIEGRLTCDEAKIINWFCSSKSTLENSWGKQYFIGPKFINSRHLYSYMTEF